MISPAMKDNMAHGNRRSWTETLLRLSLLKLIVNSTHNYGITSVTLSTSLFMFHLISLSPHFIVHVSSHIRQSIFHCSSFISFPWVHTSLIMFHFYFLQSTVHLIHFTYHSPSRSCYLIWLYSYYMVIQPHCQSHFLANPVSGN